MKGLRNGPGDGKTGRGTVAGKPGAYVVADQETDRLLGTHVLDRRTADLPGHVTAEGCELELAYLLRHSSQGAGPAFEGTTAALRAAAELPDQPVLLVTRTADTRSLRPATRLGFLRVGTFFCGSDPPEAWNVDPLA
ncbi:GNAT family N-acetyltransferase [Streptomyces sp. NPDC056160]|uniref:GNAT family N-acetyltransferase n=1 Tax=Streptomyces sp. NPDC056160 TaxID=3345731 RepID=UPI0035DDDC01